MIEKKSYTIDLSEQMAACDANYIRILQLMPDIRLHSQREISFRPINTRNGFSRGPSMTIIRVTEKFRYTSTIKISQHLYADSDHYQSPEMLVRIYHDAKTAEVIAYQHHRFFRHSYPLPNRRMYQADEKEQINFFLAEWLSVCLREGLCREETLTEKLQPYLAAG